MASKDSIHCMMQEIGPLLGLREVSAYTDRDAWALAFDEATHFDCEFESGLNRLVISGAIAEVPEGSRLAVYEILLQYNAAWTESGGVRMAVDGAQGHALMLFDLPAADLHVGLLAEVLTNMAGIQRAWREILIDLAAPPAVSFIRPVVEAGYVRVSP